MARLTAVVLLSSALLLAGCGGQDRLSSGEYQDRITSISLSSGKATQLYGDLVVERLPRSECSAKARDFHHELARIVDEVDALEPPTEVERLHDDFVTAAHESVERVEELAAEVEDGELQCGEPFNAKAYGLPSTDRAERILDQLEANGYFIRGD